MYADCRPRLPWRSLIFVLFAFLLTGLPAVWAEVAPIVVWANRAGGPLPDSATAIVADATGNLYVAGTFGGTATFGATTLTATVGYDLFLAKLSPTGTWLWAKNVEAGVPGIYPFHLSLDSAGNPVLMTSIPGDAAGDGLNMLYVAKFTSAGIATWTKKFKPGGFSSILGGALVLDAANNIYVTGTFGNHVDFGGTVLTDSGGGDIFLLKLSPAGATVAVRRFGQPGPVIDDGQGLALDAAGNLWLAANFGGTVAFGGTSLTSAGDSDVALVKLDPALNPLSAQRVGGFSTDTAYELTRDSANNLLLLGSFSEDTMIGTTRVTPDIAGQLLVTRFNANGIFGRVTSLGPTSVSGSGSRGFAPDATGNLLIVTGHLLFKLNAAGDLVWSRFSGPNFSVNSLNGVAVRNQTNVFLVGSFSGTAKFDGVTLNSAGTDDALIAGLVINTTPPPVITVQPKDQTVLQGGNTAFSVTATGDGPLSYQWFHGPQPVAGATQATLNLANVAFLSQGAYSVVVSNAGGSVTSTIVYLTVNTPPPLITLQPLSQTADLGTEVQFRVAATGIAPLVYQWQFHGTNLPLQNSTLLVVHGVRAIDAGPYTAVVGNIGGYSTSSVATLTIRMIAPAITVQPVDVITEEGATVTFSVAATGTGPLTYRWKRDGVDLPGPPGGGGPTLTIVGVKGSDMGSYTVTVSNAAGSATSLPAKLALKVPNLTGPPFTWGFLMAGPCGGAITALGTDATGNLLLVGNAPDMALPGLTNGPSCRFGMVVAKLDSTGRGLWRNHGVGFSGLTVNPSSVQADPEGNLWMAGNFSGSSMTIGATTLTLATGDMFVAKFSTNGTLVWVKQVTRAQAGTLALDSEGNAFLAGRLYGSGTPAPAASNFGTTNVSTAHPRPFIARMDSSGKFIWVRSTGDKTTSAGGVAVALAPGGDLWFAGDFNGTLEYDTNVFTSVFGPPLQNFTRTSAFIARLNRDTGLPRWAQMYQGKGSVQDIRCIGTHPAGGAILACNITDSYSYPPTGISVLSGPGLVLRIDDHGVPLAAYEGVRPVLDATVSPAGGTLLASQFFGEFYFGPNLFRSPNGQDQGAMLLLKPDLTPDLARSVTGLKGIEKTSVDRIALSAQGDALMSGSFYGTNVVFGPLVVQAPTIFSGGAFLGKLAGPAPPPPIAALINASNLRLTWPIDDWILERVATLNGSFSPFAYAATTNAANGTVTVELSLDSTGSFFRLRQP